MTTADRGPSRAEFADAKGRSERARGWRFHVGIVAFVCWFAIVIAACAAAATPPPSGNPAGILFIQPGEKVQKGPPTEELKVVMSNALVLAQNHGDDLGYPTYDATTGEIVLSVVTPHGLELILAAGISAPHRVRTVVHGAAELQRIQDSAISPRAQAGTDGPLIYATAPDFRDNRALIVISAQSQPLLDALIARYPADAIAVEVKPIGAP